MFDTLDTNHDGVITRAEFTGAMGGVTYAAPTTYAAAPTPSSAAAGRKAPAAAHRAARRARLAPAGAAVHAEGDPKA